MKISSIIGTRPNFIKYAPLSREIRKEFDEVLIHTGQHYDYEMNKIFFDQLEISEPDFHLNVKSNLHGSQTGMMLRKIEEVLLKEKPDIVLIYGDCNTTLSGALAAVKLNIKIGHVEAGLRSFDKSMPEEINRIISDHCSDLLFCPTKNSVMNLKKEGIVKGVHLTGDVMVDSLNYNKKLADKSDIINRLGLKNKGYIVVTVHRASNTDYERNLRTIIEALCELDETVVFPVHPRTKKYLEKYELFEKLKRDVIITKPLGYLDFLKLIMNSKKIVTDSGGLQKESYILGKACVTIRDNTEWKETVEDGWNALVGSNKKRILDSINNFNPKNKQKKVFGDGKSSQKILKIVSKI